MEHDWLFEVLADIKTYADRHGMSDLSAKIAEAEATAQQEVARTGPSGDSLGHKPARRG